ncbi:hypothetical protein WJX72_004000 [[Myrmecia] bisecta]|uniref:Uncharacterized protein n=1 Tax=[Myrmecia] bisecta TaxID=41462 RepID=A0AAW1PVZ7_9CHLO
MSAASPKRQQVTKQEDADVFLESDFPRKPPKWCRLDASDYEEMKKEVNGAPVGPATFSDQQLKDAAEDLEYLNRSEGRRVTYSARPGRSYQEWKYLTQTDTGEECEGGNQKTRAAYDGVAKLLKWTAPTLTYVKVCSTCHQAKIAATSFNFATTPDGFSPSCHSCAAAGASGSQSKAEPKQRRIVTEPTVTEKVCSRCEIKQPAADFPRDKYRSDGLKTTCKACNAICSAAWRKRLAPVPEPRVAEKTCKKCKETKLAGEFYRDRNNPDGLNRYCKSCSYYAKGAITAAEAPDPTANLASSDRTKVLTNGRSVSLPALAIARNSLDGRGSFEGRSSMDGRTSLEGRGGPSPGPDQSGVSGSPLSSSGPEQVVALQAENNRLVTALSQACAQAHHLAAQLSMAQQEVARLTKAMQNARVSTPAPQDSPSEPQQLQSMDTTQTVDAPAPAELPPTIEPLTERGEWDQQTMDTTMLGALHQAWMEQQGQSGSQQAPQQQQAQQPPQGWMLSGVRPDAILNGMASGHPNELQSLAFGAPLPSGVKAEPEQFNISAVAQFLSGGAQARTAFGPRLHGQLPRSSSRGPARERNATLQLASACALACSGAAWR